MARSEAKRIMRDLGDCPEVLVDFEGVNEISPSFGDEMFRVWQSSHPEVVLTPVNMNDYVRRFVVPARRAYQDAKGISPR